MASNKDKEENLLNEDEILKKTLQNRNSIRSKKVQLISMIRTRSRICRKH